MTGIKLYAEDGAGHDWYRFVLSYPPHLVRDYLNRFGADDSSCVLDPFCGTGTTIVESKKIGVNSIGIEAHPFSYFASRVKVDWTPDPDCLITHANVIAEYATKVLKATGIEDDYHSLLFTQTTHQNSNLKTIEPERLKLLLANSISPLPLHKTLVLIDAIEVNRDERYYQHERLALAKALVYSISNLHFGPEVGIGRAKVDAKVISAWLDGVIAIANDLRELKEFRQGAAKIHKGG